MTKSQLLFLDELRSIAQLGLNYSKNHYDIENYKRILELATNGYEAFTGFPSDQIKERFIKELGYVTPKIGVNGLLVDEEGKMLLEHRSDDLLWGIPGGWVDVGEGPEDAVRREFIEEANLVVEPVEVIKFITRLPGEFVQPHTSVHILYHCKYISGEIRKSHESLELKYLDHTTVKNWHKDHGNWAEEAAGYLKKINIS
jgi:8-oxo-dGTP pyrophosphatase MutT (NUDIX family)